jgi:hypothetical protein
MGAIMQDKMAQYKQAWQMDADQGTKVAKAHNLAVERVIPQLPDMAPLDLSKVSTTKTVAQPQASRVTQGTTPNGVKWSVSP